MQKYNNEDHLEAFFIYTHFIELEKNYISYNISVLNNQDLYLSGNKGLGICFV